MPGESPLPEGTPEQYEEFVHQHARKLVERYGAHGIGVGFKEVGGTRTRRIAIVFHVLSKREPPPGVDGIPEYFTYTPPGVTTPVRLITDVVEHEAARQI